MAQQKKRRKKKVFKLKFWKNQLVRQKQRRAYTENCRSEIDKKIVFIAEQRKNKIENNVGNSEIIKWNYLWGNKFSEWRTETKQFNHSPHYIGKKQSFCSFPDAVVYRAEQYADKPSVADWIEILHKYRHNEYKEYTAYFKLH